MKYDHKEGFTLIEMIASVLLIGVISFSIGMGVVQAINGYAFAKQNARTLQKGQAAVARLIKEFSSITYISAIPAPTLTSLQFSTDAVNTVLLDGTAIKFNGDILTDSVKTFELKYYDTFDFTGTIPQPHRLSAPITPSSVKIIDIEITLSGANNSDEIFKDRVFLRNLVN